MGKIIARILLITMATAAYLTSTVGIPYWCRGNTVWLPFPWWGLALICTFAIPVVLLLIGVVNYLLEVAEWSLF